MYRLLIIFGIVKFLKLAVGALAFNLKKLVQPSGEIAGLEINDSALRLIQARKGVLRRTAVLLEPGVIANGKIKNKNRFLAALRELHDQWAAPRRKVSVIAAVPSGLVVTRFFSVPAVAGADLKKIVQSNLESVSPMELRAAYSDWRAAGTNQEGKLDILGAFAERSLIDGYLEAMKKSGFLPIAVEFPALALTRLIKEYGVVKEGGSQIVIQVVNEGVNFLALRDGNLYFDYFRPWQSIREEGRNAREIFLRDFQTVVLKELEKLTFFSKSYGFNRIDSLILVTEALSEEMSNFLKINFNLPIINLRLRDFSGLPPVWWVAFGSAIRAMLGRSRDNFISLMPIRAEAGFLYEEIKFFIRVWRNTVIASLSFILLIFALTDGFFISNAEKLKARLTAITVAPEGPEVTALQEQARGFNLLVDKALAAKESSAPQSPLFATLSRLAGKAVSFHRLEVDANQQAVILSGIADSEAGAIEFKNSLIKEGFLNVSLPLSDIISNKDGTVSFTVDFRF